MTRVKTTRIGGGADYAKVSDRLKVFWEENPNGKIETERESLEDGKIRFIARIWRKSGEVLEIAKSGASAEVIKMTANATASADATKKGDKENEKLETVAVGRALAMLGYLASGEIASREEMEQFESFKADKHQAEVDEAIESLAGASTMEDLKQVFINLESKIRNDQAVVAKKDERKKELSKKEAEIDESSRDTTK